MINIEINKMLKSKDASVSRYGMFGCWWIVYCSDAAV